MIQPRDYQLEGLSAVERELQTHRSTLVEWATGLGKTTLAALLFQRNADKRRMFICERTELIDQSAKRFQEDYGLKCRVERGDSHIHHDEWEYGNSVVVASIQSLNAAWGAAKRMNKFKQVDLVVQDEAHHSRAETYERFYNYLGSQTKLVGLTATPKRLDKKGLGKHFETVAHKMDLHEAIEKGWLCFVAQEFILVEGLDFSKIETVRGDLDRKQLAEKLEPEAIIQRMVTPSLEIIHGLERGTLNNVTPDKWNEHIAESIASDKGHAPFRTIMFCASVKQAMNASEIFNRAVHGLSDWIHGGDCESDRVDKMKAFRSGKVPVICNCMVLGEGVDVPEVELILQGRPTKSISLWMQQMGRGTRTVDGCIDGLPTAQERKAAIEASRKKYVRVVDFVGNSGRHKIISSIDVLGGDMSDDVKARTLKDCIERKAPVDIAKTLVNTTATLKRESEEAYRRAREVQNRYLNAGVNYQSHKVDLFSKGGPSSQFHTNGHSQPASEKQRRVMARAGVHPQHWTRSMARWIVGALVKNHWQLPTKMEWLRRPKHNGKATA